VRDLIVAESRRRSAATGGESRIPLDAITEATVIEAGWQFGGVLPQGIRLRVRRTANLHQGGTIHDVTTEVSPELCRVAVVAAEAIGIPVTGIDLLVPDVAGEGLRLHRSQRAAGPGQPRTTAHRSSFHRLPVSRSARPAAGLDSRGITAPCPIN